MKNIISLQIEDTLHNQLKKSAEEEGLTVSAFIRRLLILYYREKDNEYKK